MKMVQGYVTGDGTFFESKLEAELFEAEMRLRGQLVGMHAKLDPEEILAIIIAVMPDIRRYIDAYQAQNTVTRDQQPEVEVRVEAEVSAEAEAVEGGGFITGTEEDLARLLKLPTRGHSDVPNVGGGSWPEEVSHSGKVDGTRVRNGDA